MKFAHIADTHIKNLKYHFEYRKVFAELYDILRKEAMEIVNGKQEGVFLIE